ncbi:hypothetical protein M3202_21480 [Alkalihalobacillus oceani]|uniref:Uncharacterized protein n=1 Tax=Halalkalibacter oceani TaxID=1653776 RepID=A0A9X2IRN1_9BACI|nr:hypothetical protein [Halalkalibacter oceani]MCM3716617.1 hypothetical protein [Halalkalibacter oceani]
MNEMVGVLEEKKNLGLILLVSLFVLTLMSLFLFPEGASASIKSSIATSTSELEEVFDDAGSTFVDLVRSASFVIAVALLIWFGIVFFFSGSLQAILAMKFRLGAFVAAILFTWQTEAILGAIFGVFGVKLT